MRSVLIANGSFTSTPAGRVWAMRQRNTPQNPLFLAGARISGRSSMRMSEGKAYALGATPDATGANIAVFSARATRVDVCFFDAPHGPRARTLRAPRIHGRGFSRSYRRGRPSHVLQVPRAWALRARGGHRLSPNKVLLDPCARAHAGKLVSDPRRLRVHAQRRRGRSDFRLGRQRSVRAEVRHRRSQFRLAGRISQAEHSVGPHHHL